MTNMYRTLFFMTFYNLGLDKYIFTNGYFLFKNIFNFGNQCGLGQVAKLSNNLILGINIIGVTEALKFGRKNGLPADETLKLLSVSTSGSLVVNNWDEVKKYKLEATLGTVYKDLTAVMKESTKKQLSLPFGGLALHLLIDS